MTHPWLHRSKIASSARNTLFFRSHTFVETANLADDGLQLHFSPDTASPGPFDALLEVFEHETREPNAWRDPALLARGRLAVRFPRPLTEYLVRVTLDGHLAYASGYRHIEIPF